MFLLVAAGTFQASHMGGYYLLNRRMIMSIVDKDKIEDLCKAAKAVFIAAEEIVVRDLADKLNWAADELTKYADGVKDAEETAPVPSQKDEYETE